MVFDTSDGRNSHAAFHRRRNDEFPKAFLKLRTDQVLPLFCAEDTMQVVVHERMCHVASLGRRPYGTRLILVAFPALEVLGYNTPPLRGCSSLTSHESDLDESS